MFTFLVIRNYQGLVCTSIWHGFSCGTLDTRGISKYNFVDTIRFASAIGIRSKEVTEFIYCASQYAEQPAKTAL